MSRNTHARLSRREASLGHVDRGSHRLHRAWSLLLILALALSLAPLPSSVVRAADPPTLSIDDVTRAEGTTGNTTFVFTVTLSAPADRPVKVSYSTADGTANAGSDYNTVREKLTIPVGQTTKTIAVTVRGDATSEPDETFTVTLSNPSEGTIADGEGLGTIQNDDDGSPPGPALSVDDVSVTEGNSGTTTANFAVSLTAPAGVGGVTFDIAAADGTATTADNDYVAQSLTGQTIPEGSQSYAFSVTVNGDTVAEPDETFFVNVANVAGATVADGQGQGTIANDDGAPPPPPGPTLAINDVSKQEGDSGTTGLAFTVTLAPATNKRVQVDYATADATASDASDYQAASGTLTFRGGETTKTITVPVNGDTAVEPNETFVVNLSNASNASIGDNQGVGTIQTDDNQPPVAANDGPYPVDEGGTLIIDAPGVLANDADAESDPLSVATPRPVIGTTAGTLTLNADGSFTYVHNGSETTGDSFTYKANDGFNDSNAATAGIMVNPVNDAPTATAQVVTADEDTAELITLAGTDPENSPLNFTIMSLPPNGTLFQGNSTATANEITTLPASVLGNELTYLPDSNYTNTGVGSDVDSFQFTAGDGALGSAAATVSLTVTPVNDAPTANGTAATTDQNEAVTVTLSGSDLETCNLTFTIVDSPDHGSLGAITNAACMSGTPNTDSATALYTPAADYIDPDSFTYKVTDSDGTPLASAPATASLTVEPPNATPEVDAATFSVAENSANGTSVGTVAATDSDAGQTLSYTITAGNTGGEFAINSSSGEITVADSAVLDFEGTKQFLLTVTATDDGEPPASGSATITVDLTNVNEAPTDITLSNNSLTENQAGGTTVGSLSTTDADAGSTHTYTLVAGTGDDDNAAFTIDGTTLKTAASFDFETKSSYSIRVETDDGNGGTFTEAITITVSNVNEAPTNITLSNSSIDENLPAATTVGTLGATDPDTGQTLTFALVTGDEPNDNASFTIDGSALKTAASFDFETTSSYSIRVQVTDNGTPAQSFTKSFTITVNDLNDAPVLADVEGTPLGYAENDAATAVTSNITVSDPDSSTLTGATVALSAGYVNGQDVLAFTNQLGITGSWNATTGVLTLSGSASPADYQTALRAVTFVNASENPSTDARTISFEVNDGTVDSNVAIRSVAVTAVNDGPVNTAPATQTVDEDTDLAFSTANSNAISISDLDAGSASVKLSLDVVHGTLTLASTSGLTFVDSTSNGSASVHVTGSIANITTALTGLKYKGALNYNGADTVTVVTNDQGNTGTGGALSDTDSVAITVNAVNDAPTVTAPAAFTIHANMKRTGLTGLLANVTDVDSGVNGCSPKFTVTNVSATNPTGGTITNLNASTGTFEFDPPAGFTAGPVTFTYTVTDDGCPDTATSAPATVTFNVSGPVIWFVDDTAAAGGTGRLSAPFNTLAAASTAIGSSTGHRVFLYDGTYGSGLTLNTNGWLIGQGVTGTGFDTFMGITPPADTLARPSIGTGTATVQGTVTLATGVIVKGLAISSGATAGLADPAGDITGVSVEQVGVTTSTGTGVNLSNIAGTLSFTGLTTNGGTGTNLTGSNGSATFTFTGVAISSGANPGFVATGGGTVNVTGSTNTLATTTGTALNVTNTTIGMSGLTFQSIAANGAVNGIVLNNTGNSGGLTVTSTGGICTIANPTCSGGTIQNTTGVGISLTSTRNLSFSNMRIKDTGDHGISGTGVVNFTLQSSVVDGAGNADNEDGIRFATMGQNNLSGTTLIKDSFVNGSDENGLYIRNDSGALSLTVDNTDFSNSVREDGILLETFGTASLTALVEDGAFSALESDGIKANANAGTLNITARNNTFTGSSSGVISDNALSFVSGGSATMKYTISGNTLNSSHNSAMILQANDDSIMHGRVTGNTITGTTNGNGIDATLAADDNSRTRLLIDGNTITGQRQGAMFFNANNTGQLDVTITNNTMNSRPSDPTAWENLNVSANGTSTACTDIRSNSVAKGGTNAGGFGIEADAFRLDDDDSPTNTILRLERGVSASNSPAQVVRDNNPTSVSNTVSIDSTITLVNSGTCGDPDTAPTP